MKVDFTLEEIESRVSSGASDPWREITLLAQELLKLKKQLKKVTHPDE